MWEVWYSLEAANYLNDNGALVAELFFAVEELAVNAGWPQTGDYQLTDGLILWQFRGHIVIYQRLEPQQVVQVAVIKPA